MEFNHSDKPHWNSTSMIQADTEMVPESIDQPIPESDQSDPLKLTSSTSEITPEDITTDLTALLESLDTSKASILSISRQILTHISHLPLTLTLLNISFSSTPISPSHISYLYIFNECLCQTPTSLKSSLANQFTPFITSFSDQIITSTANISTLAAIHSLLKVWLGTGLFEEQILNERVKKVELKCAMYELDVTNGTSLQLGGLITTVTDSTVLGHAEYDEILEQYKIAKVVDRAEKAGKQYGSTENTLYKSKLAVSELKKHNVTEEQKQEQKALIDELENVMEENLKDYAIEVQAIVSLSELYQKIMNEEHSREEGLLKEFRESWQKETVSE